MPGSVNETLRARSVAHAVYLERYKSSVWQRLARLLDRADVDLIAELQKRTASSELTQYRLELLLDSFRDLNHAAMQKYRDALRAELRGLAGYELDYQTRMLQSAVPESILASVTIVEPSVGTVYAAAMKRPFQGRVLRDWASGLEKSRLAKVTDAIRLSVVEGEPVSRAIQRIRGTKALRYQDGVLAISRREAESVARTAINHVVTRARDDLYRENADLVKGWQFVATLDARTTPECQSLDGKVYAVGEGPTPPRHFNCLPGDALVTTRHRVTGASKRWHDGDLVVIRSASGEHVSCTPNHPVLTEAGFIPAGLVREGDRVVRALGSDGVVPGDDDAQHIPARIEDVAESLWASGKVCAVPVPLTPEDFHGDAVEGQVAVIGSNRLLGHNVEASRPDEVGQSKFRAGLQGRLPGLLRPRGLALLIERLRSTADGLVSCLSESLALVRWRGGHPCGLLFVPVPGADPLGGKQPSYYRGRGAKVFGDTGDAATITEGGNGAVHRHIDPSPMTSSLEGKSRIRHAAADRVCSDPELARQILDGLAGPVAFDQVVSVERRNFRGHVYNLETASGFYVAQGIIVHNCRSSTVPVLKSWRDLGINRDELPPGTRASMNGQVPATQTYGEWLRDQPATVQDEALGKAKGALFRRGELPVERFVAPTGRPYTLDQLRDREARAFDKAGL
jgi:SPP1 gp7 family putative phage head morphogenesis protein